MAADDVLVPSFRDQAAQLWRGVTPVELLLYWGAMNAAATSPVSAMFDHLFAKLPASLATQRARALAEAADDA